MRRAMLWIAAGLALATPAMGTASDLQLVVQNGQHPLPASPVLVRLDASVALPEGDYPLRDQAEATTRYATVYKLDGATWLAFTLDGLKPDESCTLRLAESPGPNDGPGAITVEVEPHQKRVEIKSSGQPFATLNLGHSKPYFFPVVGPGGKRFTRAFPMENVAGDDRDHFHQRSMWFTYGDVNGFDFWASDPLNPPNPKFGTIESTGEVHRRSGRAVGVLRFRNVWRGPKHEPLLNDTQTYRFWDLGDSRMIDCDVTLSPAEGPVRFGDTKEGAFGLRIPSSMNVNKKSGGKITNAEGITDNDAWGKRSAWVDYSGPIDSATSGITIFNHPDSFRFPTAWHVRDYGLFAANPFGKHDFKLDAQGPYVLEPGASITLRYRVLFHKGDLETANVPELFRAYSEPPRVSVTRP